MTSSSAWLAGAAKGLARALGSLLGKNDAKKLHDSYQSKACRNAIVAAYNEISDSSRESQNLLPVTVRRSLCPEEVLESNLPVAPRHECDCISGLSC
jgi:hypothetical protein